MERGLEGDNIKLSGTCAKLNFEPCHYHAKLVLINIRSASAVVRRASGANTESPNLEGPFLLSSREGADSISKSFKKQ